jgi:rhomboid family GlyGly-CTERM serine protease
LAVALGVHLLPTLPPLLVFDRAAIAHGEWWRLVTGHWVHFTAAHLLYNLVVLAVAGAIVEIRGYGNLAALVLLAAVLIGALLYLAEPGMVRYGGLSGIATAVVMSLALHGLGDRPPWRYLSLIVLAALTAKLALEFGLGRSIVPGLSGMSFRTVPLSHAAGAIAAVLAYLGPISRRRFKSAGGA